MSPGTREPLARDDRGSRGDRMIWADWLRGLAVVLVVLYHANVAFVVVGTEPPAWATAADRIANPYRMPALMFLSGMLLSHSLGKPPRDYVWGKIRRIGWPYIIWTGVIVGFLITASQLLGQGHYDANSVVPLVLAPSTYTWYLAYLLAFYLVVLVVGKRWRRIAVAPLFVLALAINDGDGWSRPAFLLACFLLGEIAADRPIVWTRLSESTACLSLAALVFVGGAWFAVAHGMARYGALSVVGLAAVLIVGRAIAEKAAPVRGLNLLTVVGQQSIVFYVTHWVVVASVAHVLGQAGMSTHPTLLLLILMGFGLGVPAVMSALRSRSRVVGLLYEFPASRPRVRTPDRMGAGQVEVPQ